jgi:hypothetical protein
VFIAVRGGGGWRAPPPVPEGPEALARRAAWKARRAHASYKLAAKRADARARDKGHYPDRSGAAAVRTRVGGAAPPVPALPPMQQMQAHQQLAPHHQAAPRQQPAPAPCHPPPSPSMTSWIQRCFFSVPAASQPNMQELVRARMLELQALPGGLEGVGWEEEPLTYNLLGWCSL